MTHLPCSARVEVSVFGALVQYNQFKMVTVEHEALEKFIPIFHFVKFDDNAHKFVVFFFFFFYF